MDFLKMLHVVQLSYSCSQEKNCDNESCILYNIIGYVTSSKLGLFATTLKYAIRTDLITLDF